MKDRTLFALLAVVFWIIPSLPALSMAQTCNDDEAMVKNYQKSITDLVTTVKKENLDDFEKAYHQKNCMTKLTLCLEITDGLLQCLDKAAQDTTATKDQVDAAKAKRETYAKLKVKVEQYRDHLKSQQDSKRAKALIEQIELPM